MKTVGEIYRENLNIFELEREMYHLEGAWEDRRKSKSRRRINEAAESDLEEFLELV